MAGSAGRYENVVTVRKRIVYGLVALVALNVLVAVIGSLTASPKGPPSSSYATTSGGLAAYASLLEELGFEVERYRRPLADATFDPSTTVVVLDPPRLGAGDTSRLREFVEGGGRLVAGGRSPDWLGGVVGALPDWSSGQSSFVANDPELEMGEVVRSAGEGNWIPMPGDRVVAGSSDAALVLKMDAGEGEAYLMADGSPLQNRLLDEAANAALGIALAGPEPRTVVFVESVHGYGLGRGLAAIPSDWKWALGGLVFAALLWMWARAVRLGPPEENERTLPPPRRAYVDALAATLARTSRGKGGNR